MYCSNCGNQIQNDQAFCTACGTRHKIITKKEWIQLYGSTEAKNEIKLIKLLTNITLAIFIAIYAIGMIYFTIGIIIAANTLSTLIGEPISNSSLYVMLLFLLIVTGIPFAISVTFGILGKKEYRTGFSITYLVFILVPFVFGSGVIFGAGIHILIFLLMLCVPIVYVIIMQSRITKIYNQYLYKTA